MADKKYCLKLEQSFLHVLNLDFLVDFWFSDNHWHARSPHLTLPDYFLWAYLKERVYCNRIEIPKTP